MNRTSRLVGCGLVASAWSAVPLVTVGCQTTPPPIEGRADPFVPGQVNLASRRLAQDTRFGHPVATRDQAGLLHVSLPVRSVRNQSLHVDWRVTFLDTNGQPLGTFGPFTKVLRPNTPDAIAANSTDDRAANFMFDVAYAR